MQKSRRTVWRQVFSVWKNIHTAARGAKTGRYANRGYRELIVDSYIIIYKIHAKKEGSGYCYGAAWEKKFLE